MSTPSEIEKHLEILKDILNDAELQIKRANEISGQRIWPLEHRKTALTFFIGVGEKLNQKTIEEIVEENIHLDEDKGGGLHTYANAGEIACSILDKLGGGEK